LSDVRAELDRCRTELDMLDRIDQIDDSRWTLSADGKLPSPKSIVPQWGTAFAKFGIVAGATPPREAALRINGSLIRERLLTSLQIWYQESNRDQALRQILAETDPDEFRNGVRAAENAQRILADGRSPESLPDWFTIACGQDRSLDHGLRERLLLSALRVRADSFPLLMALASLDDGDIREAAPRMIGWCRAALVVRPRNVIAWNYLGVALYHVGDLPRAIEAFQEATRLDSKYVLGHINLGLSLGALKRHAEAITAFDTAIRLAPQSAPAHMHLGISLYLWKGSPDSLPRAIAALEESVRLNDQDAEAHYRLGNAYYYSGNLPRALSQYERAASLDRENPKVWYWWGKALFAAKKLPSAIAAFEKATRLDPKDARAQLLLGGALSAYGDLPGAIQADRAAVRLDPKSALAHYYLAETLFRRSKVSNTTTAPIDPPDSAEAHARRDLVAEAIAHAQEAVRLDETSVDAYALLGKILRRVGDVSGSRVALENAVRLRWGLLLAQQPLLSTTPVYLAIDKEVTELLAEMPALPTAPPPTEGGR
jgi:tetratricopeptide (TPR) repeat protein